MAMTSHTYRALGPHGFHQVHYTEWGDPGNPRVLICVHGMTRTGRDFDFLAAEEFLLFFYVFFCLGELCLGNGSGYRVLARAHSPAQGISDQ